MRTLALAPIALAVGMFSGLTPEAPAVVKKGFEIPPSKDNTLYNEESGSVSNGSGPSLFSGETAFFGPRRAVLEFDLSAIPAGSTIDSVSLTLTVTQAAGEDTTYTLHRVSQEWGEGASDTGPKDTDAGGGGAPATSGDATWLHTYFFNSFWTNPGGDFNPTPSAGAVVPAVGTVSFTSPAMAADVQAWLDNPSLNHGWLLRNDESQTRRARRLASREHPTVQFRPRLSISYSPPAPCVGELNNDGVINTADLALFLGQFGQAVVPGTGADLTGDGVVNTADLALFLGRFGQPC